MARNKRRVPKTKQAKHYQPQRRCYDPATTKLPPSQKTLEARGARFVVTPQEMKTREILGLPVQRLIHPSDIATLGIRIDATE